MRSSYSSKVESSCSKPANWLDERTGDAGVIMGYWFSLPLFLPLYDPLAMRVAKQHVLGKSERKIRVQTFDSSITPSLMPYTAGINVEALLLPPLVPRALSRLSHTSVFGSFNH